MTEIIEPQFGKITQGSIFSCAKSARYIGTRAFGLVITARCDLANDKYSILNYLPIISLVDWMKFDGFEILKNQVLKAREGEFKNKMKHHKLPMSLLNHLSRDEILENFFNAGNVDKSFKKAAPKFEELVESLGRLEKLKVELDCDRDWLFDSFSKQRIKMVKDLLLQKINGYYYITDVFPTTGKNFDECEPHIVLLRETSYIPQIFADHIGSGIDMNSLNAIHDDWTHHFSFDHDDFIMPTGQVSSPHIEHLLQTFSTMLCRIGLPNLSERHISNVTNEDLY